jgi:hypothetical protein
MPPSTLLVAVADKVTGNRSGTSLSPRPSCWPWVKCH